MSSESKSDPYGLTNAHWESLKTTANLGGWVGSRQYGSRDSRLSDAIVDAAFEAVKKRLLEWHEQDPIRHPATERNWETDES